MKKLYLLIFHFCLFVSFSFSQQKVVQVSGTPSYSYLHRNYISTGFFNNGISDFDISQSNSGLFYPKLSGKTAMFVSGFLWGTKIAGDEIPHVGGSAYRTGLQPGRILNSGLPWELLTSEDPNASNVRIYKTRRDVYPGGSFIDLSDEVLIELKSATEIRQQYETDWLEWPTADGAPYEDVNMNGVYEPNVDVPGFEGADQTIWFVANDLNQSKTQFLYGTGPIGMEVQVTIWSYFQHEAVNHVFFKKYKLINKSNTTFDSTYISIWADPDIGDAGDDFAGCDSTLNLGYAYNGNEYDEMYEFTPPAIGLTLLKGPSMDGITSLDMTASYYFARGDPNVGDPLQGDSQGSVEFYNFMQGKFGISGNPFIDLATGEVTTYALNGDPITLTGWIDGLQLPTGDRRIGISSGPFNMAPADTQEIYFSEVLGIGESRIESIQYLRFHSILSKEFYDNNFTFTRTPIIPTPSLSIEQIDNHFSLNWDADSSTVNAIENFNQDGFSFQGYNVYQLASTSTFQNSGHRLVTYDIQDGITQISGTVMNPAGYPTNGVIYYGNDTGINRQYLATSDVIDATYFIPGKKYYFAVTAYGYNPSPIANPNTMESLINIFEITFIDTTSWINYGQVLQVIQVAGTGSADIKPTVVDPYQLTTHLYKMFFTEDLSGTLQWNLRDVSLGTDVLTNQYDFSGSPNSPIADGIQIRIIGKSSLTTMSNVSLNGFSLINNGLPGIGGTNWTNDNWNITDFTYFGNSTGTSFETIGYGTQLIEELEQDYEFRWTGEIGDTVINGQTVVITKSGGSFATIYGARNYDIANHPLNPNPGSPNRFLVRIPFEVWNKDLNMQINIEIYDRSQSDPIANGFMVWYTDNRMYTQILNTPYNPNQVADPFFEGDKFTWNHVWYKSNYTTGDTIAITYDAPLQEGVDEFTFQNTIAGIEDKIFSETFLLNQNYPNPFNPSTTIQFTLPEKSLVQLNIYNILGQKINTLINNEMDSGQHSVLFNGAGLASGVYFYRIAIHSDKIQAGSFVETKKMVLMK
jgi:hypothetical protein